MQFAFTIGVDSRGGAPTCAGAGAMRMIIRAVTYSDMAMIEHLNPPTELPDRPRGQTDLWLSSRAR